MNATKEKWGFRTNPARVVVLMVVAVLLGVLVGAGVEALWMKKAHAQDCLPSGPAECEPVNDNHREVAQKIRDGVIAKSKDTFDMRPAFGNAAKVREVIEQRIKTGMIAMQGQEGGEKVACCVDGAAAAAYITLVDDPVCGAVNENEKTLDDQWAKDAMCRLNNMPDPGTGEYISAEEAKQVATVFFCGTSMALAIGLSGASGGATAAIGVSAAGGCVLSVWD